jgi:FAD/FMN-containing dehydrogenase
MAGTTLLQHLTSIVGPEHVLTGELTAGASTDWTGRWHGACEAVVRPGSTTEVASVVQACAAEGVAVVPQGGNTGLVGGAVPSVGSVVVSTARLGSIGPIDPASGQVTVGAGATLAQVGAAAAAAGWRYPVDFAARDTATIGGSIATNAGGHHVLRHGMTRRHVHGIEAVLADGRVVAHMSGLVKDNTGYDLAGLLCGSEGTLGVITAARMGLIPGGGDRAVALVGLADLERAVGVVAALRQAVPEVEALELMLDDGLEAVGRHLGTQPPITGAAAVLLVEVVARRDAVGVLTDALAAIDGVLDSAVAHDSPTMAALWRWREAHTEVINSVGPHPPHKLDISIPIGATAAFVDEVRVAVREHDPEAHVWIFGHAGDGNLHVNVTGPSPDDDAVDQLVVRLVAGAGGSISAEHGIGRAKRQWLHLTRSPEEIEVFRAIKGALDPTGILNPGVLLPGPGDRAQR